MKGGLAGPHMVAHAARYGCTAGRVHVLHYTNVVSLFPVTNHSLDPAQERLEAVRAALASSIGTQGALVWALEGGREVAQVGGAGREGQGGRGC